MKNSKMMIYDDQMHNKIKLMDIRQRELVK